LQLSKYFRCKNNWDQILVTPLAGANPHRYGSSMISLESKFSTSNLLFPRNNKVPLYEWRSKSYASQYVKLKKTLTFQNL